MTETFGIQLRRRRLEAGLSLAEFSKKIIYSKSYLSKIENDQKPPTRDFAGRCDDALEAGGSLVSMVAVTPEPVAPDVDEGGPRLHELWGDQRPAGAPDLLGFRLARGGEPVVDDLVVTSLRASFDQLRALGTITRPVDVIGQVLAHLNALRSMSATKSEPTRSNLLRLAARSAEYAGWMCQEGGNEDAAKWWTDRAAQLSIEGGDNSLATFTLVRHAELAMYRQDAISTVELTTRAQTNRDAGPRVLGLAARCEAQGHALAGDRDAFERALERAMTLLTTPEPTGVASPLLGSSTVSDQVALARGWSLYELGDPGAAAELLDQQVPAIAVTARRARARFGARRALAHAANGEIEHACAITHGVLDDVAHVDSATVRLDLGRLARTLIRWHTSPAVRDVHPLLIRALHTNP